MISPERKRTIHAAHQFTASLFFHRQGGIKITLPADNLFQAEGLLEFFEVQLRYLQIDRIHGIDFRLVCRGIALSLRTEDIHRKGYEGDYPLLGFYRTFDVVDLEVAFPYLLAVHVSRECDVLYHDPRGILDRKILDSQIDFLHLGLFTGLLVRVDEGFDGKRIEIVYPL